MTILKLDERYMMHIDGEVHDCRFSSYEDAAKDAQDGKHPGKTVRIVEIVAVIFRPVRAIPLDEAKTDGK